MKISCAVALAMLAGVGMGAVGVHRLHAQAKPPVYMIVDNEVTDAERYVKEYVPLAQPTVKAYGGRYIAEGKGTVVDGAPLKGRVAIVAWDSMEKLQAWRNSPEYMKARAIGDKYAKFRVFAVDGVAQ
jgi:uncharacterized protein (DUF1330 family)